VQCHSCIGGKSLGDDIKKLDGGVHVLAGTPGRVFGKDILAVTKLHWVVIIF